MHSYLGDRGITFHHNSDLSGDVIISGAPFGEFRIAGKDILKLAAAFVAQEKIGRIEQMDYREVLLGEGCEDARGAQEEAFPRRAREREEMFEGRLAAAQREIVSLHRQLDWEKTRTAIWKSSHRTLCVQMKEEMFVDLALKCRVEVVVGEDTEFPQRVIIKMPQRVSE